MKTKKSTTKVFMLVYLIVVTVILSIGFIKWLNEFQPLLGCDNSNNMHARMRDLDSQFDEVTINGKTQEISGMTISYDQVVKIAFPNSLNLNCSIIIEESKENSKKSQILLPNSSVEKFNGMKIKCHWTGNSQPITSL